MHFHADTKYSNKNTWIFKFKKIFPENLSLGES